VLVVEKEHQVIAAFPLMITEYRIGPLKMRTLENIGSVNSNHIGLMSHENEREALFAFLTFLSEELGRSNLILRLTFVPDDSKVLDLLRKYASEFSSTLVIKEKVNTLAPYIPLPETWSQLFRSLSGKRRWVLTSKLRSLEKDHAVEFQECTPDILEDKLGQFFDLHQKRWQSVNVNGVFTDTKVKEFYRDISKQFIKKKWLFFSWLNVDGEMASGEYCFVYNGKLYAVTAARDLRYSQYSVGHLHYMFMAKEAINRHLHEFDFLKGDEPYKFYWTKSTRKYIDILMVKKSVFSQLRIKSLQRFLYIYWISRYSLREAYSRYLLKRKWNKEKELMGLKATN
jgi:CelD/BcsL family acetyltransferase involved in cellulose biosynthesis